jgi:hypothetical protein
MERVFISSLFRGEMAAIRQAAKQAVEAMGMVAVMFETTGASERASRTELLEKVARSDAVLLLLGAEYGETGESGFSPTEDEYNAARETGKPVLALVQEGVDREPAQHEFVARVRGGWDRGSFAPGFTGAGDVGLAVTRTLNEWRNRQPAGAQVEVLSERARTLGARDRVPERFLEWLEAARRRRAGAEPAAAGRGGARRCGVGRSHRHARPHGRSGQQRHGAPGQRHRR